MGLWGRICTIGLAILQSPANIWDAGRQEIIALPHSSAPSTHHTEELPVTSENSYGPPPGIYAPEIWQPTVDGGVDEKMMPNTYADPFQSLNDCNNAKDRRLWCWDANIYTDYEDTNIVPIGVVRKYTLNVTSTDVYCADGYCKNATLINGQYPGPLIRGNWGDTFEITVNNQMENCNGTSFHWHGIRQWRTVWEDGVSGVTQCPIPPGKSQTYRWRAMQYGTSWYHSHFSLQYANGVAGPLVIDGPTSANYHVDKGPIMLTDWYHHDAFGQYYNEIAARPSKNFLRGADSVLINGRGNYTATFDVVGTGEAPPQKYMDLGCHRYDGSGKKIDSWCIGKKYASRFVTHIEPSGNELGTEKKYKYRLINMSTMTHFAFWIDDHEFEVVSTDFVPIIPVKRNFINVAIGQRYDIIITAKPEAVVAKHPNYWMKMRLCNNYCLGDPCPIGKNCTYVECRQGILSYDDDRNNGPIKSPDFHSQPPPDVPDTGIHQLCTDPELDSLNPIVRRDLRNTPGLSWSMKFDDPFEVDRRAGTQNFTEVFGDGDDHHTSDATADEVGTNRNDEVSADGHFSDPGTPLHPLPPPIDPLDATKPHIWDFGSSRVSTKHKNGSYVSFMIDWANPGLLLADAGVDAHEWNPRYYPVILEHPDAWTVFAIASNWTESENHGRLGYQTVPGGAHPIHLHGHDFVVLYQSDPGDIFYYGRYYTMDLVNPVRRDVVMLPANGFVVVAFRADNPGTWLMHCHIAWHASSGLALQWVERPKEIPSLVGKDMRAKMTKQCVDWKKHEKSECKYRGLKAEQDDSGI